MGKKTFIRYATLLMASCAMLSCVKDKQSSPVGAGESIPPFATVTMKGQNVSDKDILGKLAKRRLVRRDYSSGTGRFYLTFKGEQQISPTNEFVGLLEQKS